MRAGSASRTALAVAGGVVLADLDPRLHRILPPQTAALTRELLGASVEGRRLLRWIDTRAGRTALRLLERMTIPGIAAHWACRKRWLDDAWIEARDAGADTLVVLASGFDTLSLRAVRDATRVVRAIDVDHPATLGVRRPGLAAGGGPHPLLVEHDLSTQGLVRALEGAIPAGARTFVVVEGVLMYLGRPLVDAMFAALAALPSNSLRVAFTFMETTPVQPPAFRPRSRLIDAWLAWRGEPFQSGIEVDGLREWLHARGFALRSLAREPCHALVDRALPKGECAAIADRVSAVPSEPAHAH